MTKPPTHKTKSRKRVVKAWAVLMTFPLRKKRPIEPKISYAKVDSECGSGATYAMGIYGAEWEAKDAASNYPWEKTITEIVVPCTITYELPTK